jgi:outer membrane protein TolC
MPAHYWQPRRLGVLFLTAGLLAGCTAKYYRRSADTETYRIIQEVDRKVFGKTNEFSIDTRYSNRDPKHIPPEELIEDRMATNRRVINLDQALDLAVENSREYQTQKEQLYLAALELTGARYAFTPQVLATSKIQDSSEPFEGVYITPKSTNYYKGRSQTLSVENRLGVSTVLRTGGKLTVLLINDLVHYFIRSPGSPERSAISHLTVDFTQPLLRGFGVNDPRVEALTQSERDVVYAVRAFSRYQQQFAVDTVNDYFSLLTLKDIVRNNYRNYTNRIETTKYLEARAVDRERKSSVDDARTAELGAKRDYINSLAGYLTQLDAFKLRLGIPVSEKLFLDDRDLRELIASGVTPIDIDSKAGFLMCIDRQMEILTAIDKFEDLKRKVRVSRDQLRPEVNFFAGAQLDSEPPYDYLNFDPNKARYQAGIEVNLPIDRQIERNTYRTTLVRFEQQLRALTFTLDDYRNRVDRGLRNLEAGRLNYLNGLESLKVVQRRVENNTMLLEAGRATIRDLREAQDALVEEENRLALLYTAYLSARLNVLLDIGIIETDPDKFWLIDPLKDTLTPAQRGAPPLRMPDDQVIPPESFLEPAT